MSKTFTISIDCDNAAFEGRPSIEIARQLQQLINDLPGTDVFNDRDDRGAIRDINGNTVGTWWYIGGVSS